MEIPHERFDTSDYEGIFDELKRRYPQQFDGINYHALGDAERAMLGAYSKGDFSITRFPVETQLSKARTDFAAGMRNVLAERSLEEELKNRRGDSKL